MKLALYACVCDRAVVLEFPSDPEECFGRQHCYPRRSRRELRLPGGWQSAHLLTETMEQRPDVGLDSYDRPT
jgi:hypothetical protein